MKAVKLKLIAVGLLMSLVADLAFSEGAINLGVGEEHVLQLPEIAKTIDLSNSSVVKIRKGVTKATIHIRGVKPGLTDCVISLPEGQSLSYKITVGSDLTEAKKALSKIGSIRFREKEGKIFLAGSVNNRQEQVQLNDIKQKFSGIIIDGTEENSTSSNTIVRTINRVLKENDLGNIQAHAYGKIIVLEGSPRDDSQGQLALRIANMISSGVESRLSKDTKGAPPVSIEVMFIEAIIGNELQVGFEPKFTADESKKQLSGIAGVGVDRRTGSTKLGNTNLFWQVGGLSTFLEMIQLKTSSRVLSNPKLVTRSGEQAKFHSGRTIYLSKKTMKDEQVLTEFFPLNVGIELNITPKLDQIGQIDAAIKTSVSELDDVKDQSVPSVSVSEVETAVTISDGQTILLSGLLSKRESKGVDRVPLLADIPIIGELFKKRRKMDHETELIILVTINRINAQDDRAKAAGSELLESSASAVEFSIVD